MDGRFIRWVRETKDMSRKEVADKVGVTSEYIRRLETDRKIGDRMQAALLDSLGVRADHLDAWRGLYATAQVLAKTN